MPTVAFYGKALVNLLLDYRQDGDTGRLLRGLEALAQRMTDGGKR